MANFYRAVKTVLVLLTMALSVGCGKKAGCGEPMQMASSKVNLAIRDEDPAAIRKAAKEIAPLLEGTDYELMKLLPGAVERLADQLEKAKASGKSEDMASYRASIVGIDTRFKVIGEYCEK